MGGAQVLASLGGPRGMAAFTREVAQQVRGRQGVGGAARRPEARSPRPQSSLPLQRAPATPSPCRGRGPSHTRRRAHWAGRPTPAPSAARRQVTERPPGSTSSGSSSPAPTRTSVSPRPGGSAPAPRLPSCGRAAFTCVRRRSVSASCSFSRKAPVTRWASWSCPCPARPGGCPPPSCPWAQGRPATPGTAAFTPAGWGLPLGGRAAGCEPGGGARQASRGRDRTSVVPVGPGTVWAPCRPAGSTCWNPARTHLLSLASAALRRAFVDAGASRPSAVASVTRSLLVGRQVPSGALRAGAPRRAVPLSASRWRVRPTDGRHRVAQAGRTGHRAAGCLGRGRRPWQRGGAPCPAQSSRGLS